MDEQVILKLSTYDNLQMELIEAQDEIKRLRDTLDNIQIFKIENSGYNNIYRLKFTEHAKEYLEKLKRANPDLNYLKGLPVPIEWDFAESRAVETDD